MRYVRCAIRSGILLTFLLSVRVGSAQTKGDHWPNRVLITNDDGIDMEEIRQLAVAFSEIAETYVVAPLGERSGSSTHVTLAGPLRVEPRQFGDGIHAWGVDGFPADCVLLGVAGFMRDGPPDLVISGINTGANTSDTWVASGTVGAARIAASLGLPAIAVSGLDIEIPGSLEAAAKWVVRLAQSAIVRDLRAPRYLTVSIPRIPPKDIKGIRIAEHDTGYFRAVRFRETEDGVWQSEIDRGEVESSAQRNRDADVYLYESGYIVIVPMRVDEHDREALSRLKETIDFLPKWGEPDPN
jgi:5'-nucleotidase